MNKNLLIVAVIALLAGGGAGFFGGMKYQQSKSPAFNRQFGTGNLPGRNGQTGQAVGQNRGGATAFRPVSGSIISSDDKSITVKMSDGSNRIVILSDSTQITKGASATKIDLTTGQNVAVFGTINSDGSVTAQSVQLNPQFGMGSSNTGPTQTPK